jgi:hypothetical protein
MSPFEDKSEVADGAEWREQAHASATQKLAQALAEQEAIRPATNALEFQLNLSAVIKKLADEEVALIEKMTGMDLVRRLVAAQTDQTVEFTAAQAQQLGAFVEDAIGDGDLETPDQIVHGRAELMDPEGSRS